MNISELVDRLPPQGLLALKGATSLMGCMSNPTISESQDPIYKYGDVVCYGDANKLYTLLEDYLPGQMAVRAKDSDGKITMIYAEWIRDKAQCQ